MKADIAQLDTRFQQRKAELKFEIVRWMAGLTGGAVITLIVAA